MGMVRVTETTSRLGARPGSPVLTYTGQVVYIFTFDIAYEMLRQPLGELLGQPVAQFTVDASKRSPRQLVFYRPQMVRLPPLERLGPHGVVRVDRTVKILPVGAISITVRVPFTVHRLEDLVAFHDLHFSNSNGSLVSEVRALADEIRCELAPQCIRPVERLMEEEGYPVFCIESPPALTDGVQFSAETWLTSHRDEVAALLTKEPELKQLSEQEVAESTGKYLSYYAHDLVVIDWDAALILDEPQYFDEALYVMELANVQLAELEAYDKLLDETVERSYRDLERPSMRGRADVLKRLREIRIDLARLSDELSNITKFFGDWHLARIYQGLSLRFHLSDWHSTIDEKLRTLDDLYGLHKQEQNNRLMLMLELTIVLLFVIDLVILVIGLHKER
jgi:hypothetical protein